MTRSPCVQTLPSCTMGKEGFNIWTSSTEELLPLTHLSTIPMLETSGFWHIFFLLFLIMIELVNAQYRLCKISKNMFHSCLVFLLTALSQPPWFLLQPGACQPRGNPWEIRPQWPGERSSNHRFHISEIWPKWLLRWFDILRCVGMNATCTEPEAEGNETRIRQVGICCLQDHKQLVSKKNPPCVNFIKSWTENLIRRDKCRGLPFSLRMGTEGTASKRTSRSIKQITMVFIISSCLADGFVKHGWFAAGDWERSWRAAWETSPEGNSCWHSPGFCPSFHEKDFWSKSSDLVGGICGTRAAPPARGKIFQIWKFPLHNPPGVRTKAEPTQVSGSNFWMGRTSASNKSIWAARHQLGSNLDGNNQHQPLQHQPLQQPFPQEQLWQEQQRQLFSFHWILSGDKCQSLATLVLWVAFLSVLIKPYKKHSIALYSPISASVSRNWPSKPIILSAVISFISISKIK